jgi:hypothetical protein
MSKKSLKIAAITMLILNLGLITLLIIGRPHHPRPPREVIVEKLQLDAEQTREYDELITDHRKVINALDIELKLKKGELYTLLTSDESSSKEIVLDEISEIVREIENANFRHFEALKNIVKENEEQLKYFYSLANDLAKIFSPREAPEHP